MNLFHSAIYGKIGSNGKFDLIDYVTPDVPERSERSSHNSTVIALAASLNFGTTKEVDHVTKELFVNFLTSACGEFCEQSGKISRVAISGIVGNGKS